MNAVHRSCGGGRIKAGTLITSTRISQSTSNARKNNTGSATFFHENFTALLRADVNGKLPTCQENRTVNFAGEQLQRRSWSLIKKVRMQGARRIRERRRTRDMGCWSIGILERWVLDALFHYSINPLLQSFE